MEGVCFINNGNRLMWINRTNITIMPSTSGHFRGCGICGVYFHSCVSVSLRSHFIKFGYFLKYFFQKAIHYNQRYLFKIKCSKLWPCCFASHMSHYWYKTVCPKPWSQPASTYHIPRQWQFTVMTTLRIE